MSPPNFLRLSWLCALHTVPSSKTSVVTPNSTQTLSKVGLVSETGHIPVSGYCHPAKWKCREQLKAKETIQNQVMENSCTLEDGFSSTSKFIYKFRHLVFWDEEKRLCKSNWYLIFDLYSNNSIEVNLLECCEKDDFKFDAITADTMETESPAGKIAAQLQD